MSHTTTTLMTMMEYMMDASVSRVLRGWYARVRDLIPFYILNYN